MRGTFLGMLGEEDRTALRGRGSVRRFERGEVLFRAGEPPDDVHVLVSGNVKLGVVTTAGREVIVAVRGPGSLLGEQSAIDGEPRSADGTALDDVEALVLGVAEFRAYLAATPRASLALAQGLSARLREASRRQVEYGAHDTVGRVAARLVELAVSHGVEEADGAHRIELGLTQEELAGWTGSSREAVARALATLRRPGWVETRRRAVVVHDLEALRERGNV